MALKLVLDTNIYCDYAEGLSDAVDAMSIHGEEIFISSIVIGELLFGFMKGKKREWNERKLRQITSRLNIHIIDVTESVARKYATLFLSLQARGAMIPINDVWIAACCMEVGGTLLTRDKHFQFIDQIETILL